MDCLITVRLVFIGLWKFCDDAGAIAAEVVDHYSRKWSANGLIIFYERSTNGQGTRRYLQITGWKHQRIDKPQKHPLLPRPFDEPSESIPRMVAERPMWPRR